MRYLTALLNPSVIQVVTHLEAATRDIEEAFGSQAKDKRQRLDRARIRGPNARGRAGTDFKSPGDLSVKGSLGQRIHQN